MDRRRLAPGLGGARMTAVASDAMTAQPTAPYDVDRIRADFPILRMQVYGKPLVYLDNAASAQKPQAVLDPHAPRLHTEYANVHRGLHYLANAATEAYEGAREKVRALPQRRAANEEIIFTRNATEAINLVAYTFGRERIKAGRRDRALDHGAPFQHRALALPARAPGRGDQMGAGRRRRQLPPRRIREAAHAAHQDGGDHPHVERARHHRAGQGGGALGACARHPGAARRRQAAVHLDVDVQDIGCDFYVFTGHKLYGPTGIGVLYGKHEALDAMPPFKGGGEMIREVFEDRITYGEPPHKFEAGTPPIVQAIGLGAAIDYVETSAGERASGARGGALGHTP